MSDLFSDRNHTGDFTCPWCGEKNDRALDLSEEGIKQFNDGDTGICFNCSRPGVYQEVGPPRKPTEQEWAELNANPDITKIRKAIFMSNKGNVSYQDLGIATLTEEGDDE